MPRVYCYLFSQLLGFLDGGWSLSYEKRIVQKKFLETWGDSSTPTWIYEKKNWYTNVLNNYYTYVVYKEYKEVFYKEYK